MPLDPHWRLPREARLKANPAFFSSSFSPRGLLVRAGPSLSRSGNEAPNRAHQGSGAEAADDFGTLHRGVGCLGPSDRCPFSPTCLVGRVPLLKMMTERSWYQLILTSLLEDLVSQQLKAIKSCAQALGRFGAAFRSRGLPDVEDTTSASFLSVNLVEWF